MSIGKSIAIAMITMLILGIAIGSIIDKAFGEEVQPFTYATVYVSSNTDVGTVPTIEKTIQLLSTDLVNEFTGEPLTEIYQNDRAVHKTVLKNISDEKVVFQFQITMGGETQSINGSISAGKTTTVAFVAPTNKVGSVWIEIDVLDLLSYDDSILASDGIGEYFVLAVDTEPIPEPDPDWTFEELIRINTEYAELIGTLQDENQILREQIENTNSEKITELEEKIENQRLLILAQLEVIYKWVTNE